MRYMVITGNPIHSGKKTEILDLADPNKSCLLDDIESNILYRYIISKNSKLLK